MELTEGIRSALKTAAAALKGHARRVFVAQVVRDLGRGGHRQAQAQWGGVGTRYARASTSSAQLRSINASNTTYTPPVPAHRLVLGLAKNHGAMLATPVSHYWSQN